MSAIGLLFRDLLRRDRIRLFCAAFGIAAASALLTWTIGLAETTHNQCRPLADSMGRPFDCWVATGRASATAPKGSGMQSLTPGSPIKMIPKEVIEAVKASPDVAECLTTTVFRCKIDYRPDGRPIQGPGITAGIAAVRDFPECPYPAGLQSGRWPKADAAEPEFAMSPRPFGEDMPLPPLGSKLRIVTPLHSMDATLVGYLDESIAPVPGFPTLFASDQLAEAAAELVTASSGPFGAAVTETPPEQLCNLMLLKIKPFHATNVLAKTVRTVSPDDDSAMLITREGLLRQLRQDATNNLLTQLPLLVALACVATLCMIINALCMGIEQNRLRYARLRAIGMTTRQLMRLVLREGGFLTGTGGVIGFCVGFAILAGFVSNKPLVFPDGLLVSWITPLAVACALGISALIAFIAPLRRVRTLSPCELRTNELPWRSAHPVRRALLAILALLPVLFTVVRFSPNPYWRSAWFLVIGLPLAITGLILLVKPMMQACERLLSRPLGALFGLRPEILRGSLTRAANRNARMALTLMTGLGAFFAIHIWGASLTNPFIPTRNFPPAIVSILPNGVSDTFVNALDTQVYTPFSAEQYPLAEEDFQSIADRAGALPKQNNILLIGTRGEEGVTITEMFARQCKVKVGDTFRIQRKDVRGNVYTLPLTITKVVHCNWHLVTARAQLRARNGAPMATLGPVFVSEAVAKQWDPEATERTRFLWMNTLPEAADTQALYSATELLEHALQTQVNADQPPVQRRRGGPPMMGAQGSNVVVHLRDEISDGTLAHSSELLGELARIPLWSLLILCTGFISLLAANVRAMAGELKTLHAIGMTRGQMGRFLFAQALMLCCVAAVLSLVLGLTIGWGFTGWTLAWMPFGGLPTVLEIPVARLLQGLGVLVLATLVITPLPIAFLVRHLLKR